MNLAFDSAFAMPSAETRGWSRASSRLMRAMVVRRSMAASALHAAAARGDLSRADEILSRTGEPDRVDPRTGCTPLHLAAARGCRAVVERLLAAGACADVVDRLGRTPADYAASRRDVLGRDVVGLLAPQRETRRLVA